MKAILLAILLTIATPAVANCNATCQESLKGYVVKVNNIKDRTLGSAVYLGNGFWATAKHVSHGSNLYSKVGELHLIREFGDDLALLYGPRLNLPRLEYCPVGQGSQITMIGYPFNITFPLISTGRVMGITEGYILASVVIYPGTSGGGLFSTSAASPCLAGVTTAVLLDDGSRTTNLSLFTSVREIYEHNHS